MLRDRRTPELTRIVDAMVDLRRISSAARGYPSAFARTLERCRVGEADICLVTENFLRGGVDSFARLEDEIRDVVGPVDRPLMHFEYAICRLLRGKVTPMFALDDCLSYILAVAGRVFGLEFEREGDGGLDLITLRVHRAGTEIGKIKLDLWVTERRPRGANHTWGIRNRTDWNGIRQQPVAYVSCRFSPDRDGRGRITFQNVHSLFHELGHAVNHILVRKRVSNQSGLDYLPAERLENLSMWFEKWAYHPEFADHLQTPNTDRAALARCVTVHKLEFRRSYLQRAVLATLDLALHRSGKDGLRDAYARVDDRFGVSRYLAFDELPEYFTWPMYVSHPGASFSYLWGSADSCEKFTPFHAIPVADIAKMPDPAEMFSACFDFDEPSIMPDTAALFALYDQARLADLT
jgi:oligopeptidase A